MNGLQSFARMPVGTETQFPCCRSGSARRSGRGRRRHSRPAFTLFEMLLVMAVMVLVVGIAWPSLSSIRHRQHLHQSAETVKVRMMGARVHAIESGLTYQFRYAPGGREFVVVPYSEISPDTPASGPGAVARLAGSLATTVQFDADLSGGDTTSAIGLNPALLDGIPEAAEFHEVSWSAPVLFFPDGTATGTEVVIKAETQQSLRLTIRAFTGGVTVTAVE